VSDAPDSGQDERVVVRSVGWLLMARLHGAPPGDEPDAQPPVAIEAAQPDPGPSAAPQPVASTPAASEAATSDLASSDPQAAAEAWKDDYVRVHPPRYRGTWLFVGAGAVVAGTIGFQLIDALVCGGCAAGFVERGALGLSIGLSAGGGVMRARHDSWSDAAYRRVRRARPFVISGALLLGAGAALALVNDGFWWSCWSGRPGPYSRPADFEWTDSDGIIYREEFYDCRYGVPQGVADTGGVVLASGAGLLGYGLMLRRRQELFRGAKVISISPTIGPGRVELGIGGRF
jgi:hypothetical protein